VLFRVSAYFGTKRKDLLEKFYLQGLRQVSVLSVVVKALQVLEFLFGAPKLLVLLAKFEAKCLLKLGADEVFILEEPPVNLNELVHLLHCQAAGELAGKVLELLRVFSPESVDEVCKGLEQSMVLYACDLLLLKNPTVDGVGPEKSEVKIMLEAIVCSVVNQKTDFLNV